ncbi:MAG: HIT domain-containing protein [Candidatus Peribacteria bacterium]|jgi:diadenosine tetraphosphate (Ap4A) HIT family hydrolase|nr:HIT domain-containing protein [Candidatus Peribacteria bacterium]
MLYFFIVLLMTDCIFCSIAEGKSSAFKLRENEEFLAFFDIFPNTKGQTLVVPKKHYDSDLFLIDEKGFYEQYFQAAREVVQLLKKGLNVSRVAMVMEGLAVAHLHLKLYPLYEGVPMSVEGGAQADFEVLGALQTQVVNGAALK